MYRIAGSKPNGRSHLTMKPVELPMRTATHDTAGGSTGQGEGSGEGWNAERRGGGDRQDVT